MQKSYNSAIRRYTDFCKLFQLPPLPLSEETLCYYVAFLADHNVAHQSIKCYLSGVRHFQIAQGLLDPKIPNMTKLALVLRGIRSTQSKNRGAGRIRLPITPPILRKIRAVWNEDPTNFDCIMLWAASTLCFFGFFRAGEITTTCTSTSSYDPRSHLSLDDIAVDNPAAPSILQVHLKVSKTDPFRKGIDVYIGRTNNDLCPVAAMMAYLAVRGNNPGALFRFKDGRLLSRVRFVECIRAALARSGLDQQKYAGHSFRSGAATTAAQCGLNDATIKLLGRWQSCAYLLYVKTPRHILASLSSKLSNVQT